MCDHCDWDGLLQAIEELLEDPDRQFAAQTLHGIHDWVEAHEHATDAQFRAVENISKAERPHFWEDW